MSDLPAQGRYQQMHARPVSGEELEVLGKTAASKWRSGEFADLSESVIATVKHAGLSPEQVKRVVEFTNTDAFLHEFKKEGAEHKVIEFAGGPADPSEILKDLNDGGGGSVFDRGTLDYGHAPGETKVSSAYDPELEAMFGTAPALPFAEPLQEAVDMRDKLAAAFDNMTGELTGLERMYGDLSEGLYQQVKQAALGGHSLGNIAGVMAVGVPDDEYLKVAFQMLTPRLLKEGVFGNIQMAVESMDKTASGRVPNAEHPLVTQSREFSECLLKLAQTRAARAEVQQAYGEITTFVKSAGKEGVLVRGAKVVQQGAERAAGPIGAAVGKAKSTLFGGTGAKTKGLVEGATKKAPAVAALAGTAIAARHIGNDSTVRHARYTAKKELMPWTDEYKYETARERGEVQ